MISLINCKEQATLQKLKYGQVITYLVWRVSISKDEIFHKKWSFGILRDVFLSYKFLDRFMELKNWVLRSFINLFMIILIHGIFIYSKSEDDHMDHLRDVLQVLKEMELLNKFSK